MKQVLFFALFGIVACDVSSIVKSSSQYGAPSSQYLPPARQYGAPFSHNKPPAKQYIPPSTKYGTPILPLQTPTNAKASGRPLVKTPTPAKVYGPPQTKTPTPAKVYGPPLIKAPTPAKVYGPPLIKTPTPAKVYGPPIRTNQQAAPVPILRQDSTNNGDGTYNYSYQTGDGIAVQETGDARGAGTKAHGGFAYVAPSGEQVRLQYTANENGFLPDGTHVPNGLINSIRKSIEYNLAEERRGVVDDGQYRDSQGYGTQVYRLPQKYGPPSKFNVPQRYSTVQNAYLPPKTQTGHKY